MSHTHRLPTGARHGLRQGGVRGRPGGFEPIDLPARYGVVSNDFMRRGGDGDGVFAEKGRDADDYGPTLDGVLTDSLARRNEVCRPHTDGRIRKAE